MHVFIDVFIGSGWENACIERDLYKVLNSPCTSLFSYIRFLFIDKVCFFFSPQCRYIVSKYIKNSSASEQRHYMETYRGLFSYLERSLFMRKISLFSPFSHAFFI